MQRPISKETLSTLARFDTCSVTNAIECFEVRLRNEGFTDASIRCRYPHFPPMVGYAMTLRVRSSSPSWKGHEYFDRLDWWQQLQGQSAPHVLVVQDIDPHPGRGAFVGEMHAAILQALGSVGAITNGAVRDLEAVEQLGFPLFSEGLAVSHAYAHVVDFGGEVDIGGLRIAQGDLLHGDRHGIVRIPLEIAEKIPQKVMHLRERQRRIVKYCRAADFSFEGLRRIAVGNACSVSYRPGGVTQDH